MQNFGSLEIAQAEATAAAGSSDPLRDFDFDGEKITHRPG